MKVLAIMMAIFTHWRFWAAAVFFLILYYLVSQLTALDKKPIASYRLLKKAPKFKTEPAEEPTPEEEPKASEEETA